MDISQPFPTPLPNQMYYIEKYIASRIKEGKLEFLIKWKGYPHEYNSWEPAENIETITPTSTTGINVESQEEQMEEFVVEKILAKRILTDGTMEYLLKWKDYPKEENSWVRKEDLDCPDLLADFEREVKTKRMPNNGRAQTVPSSSTSTSATATGAAAGTVAANQVQTNPNQVVTTQGLNINLNQPHNERDQTDNGDRNETINVIGAQKINGSFSYNIKKKMSSTLTVVYMLSSEDATQRYPQEIVKFWETLGEKILTTRTTTTP